MPALPHVVILGGGFGGLDAARTLAGAPVRVTLIDRHNYHLFQPLLYQVATASLSPGDIASPIRWILRRQQNVSVLLAEVRGIDVANRRILLDAGGHEPDRDGHDRGAHEPGTAASPSSALPAPPAVVDYDYLIVATGAAHACTSGTRSGRAERPGSRRSMMRWRSGGRCCSHSKRPNVKLTTPPSGDC